MRRRQAALDELSARIAWATSADDRVEPLRGLQLLRASSPTALRHGVVAPACCVIAQGRKEILLGRSRYTYDPARYLLTTIDVPVASQILDASHERPYLSVRLQLDPMLVSAVLLECDLPVRALQPAAQAIGVSPLDTDLLDVMVRLVRLIDDPAEARVPAPLVTRELIARLLMGTQGDRLRHMAMAGGFTHRIARAVGLLRSDVRRPLRMAHIAEELGMSVSSLHHQFKAVTAMSPLQYQKRLRLQEARRLMLGEQLDAASAGARVGYDDASQFSRDYKRLFGRPPARDIGHLRAAKHDGRQAAPP